MNRLPPLQRNANIRRERDRRALTGLFIVLACGLVIACGFVAAVGQHFSAVRYGYQNEELRQECARLVAEQEQLLLALDRAAAPGALEQAARRIGMQAARPAQLGALPSASRRNPANIKPTSSLKAAPPIATVVANHHASAPARTRQTLLAFPQATAPQAR